MILLFLAIFLFLVGLYGVATKRNLIKIVIGLTIMEYATFLILALIGYRQGAAPPIVVEKMGGATFVDALPQALVLTAIVISLATTALLLSIALRIYHKYGTFDVGKIRRLKG
ncbi:NADH-quinone oxidoreductase subunit K [bacterium]|nr:NADH-quinone oxidoreductase subunit K [bacterium]